jgi:hypothetical protein
MHPNSVRRLSSCRSIPPLAAGVPSHQGCGRSSRVGAIVDGKPYEWHASPLALYFLQHRLNRAVGPYRANETPKCSPPLPGCRLNPNIRALHGEFPFPFTAIYPALNQQLTTCCPGEYITARNLHGVPLGRRTATRNLLFVSWPAGAERQSEVVHSANRAPLKTVSSRAPISREGSAVVFTGAPSRLWGWVRHLSA